MNSSNPSNAYRLTKSKIMAGLQCHKKLWFDINNPIKKDLHVFHIGNRFGELARQHYGNGLDLSDTREVDNALKMTHDAISDLQAPTIYEAAFLHDETLVRLDVLRRMGSEWEVIEIKSSTSLREEHISDAALQAYIAACSGLKINKVTISHINKEFLYKGDGQYSDLFMEIDVSERVSAFLPRASFLISQLKPISDSDADCPKISVGVHCKTPHKCQYIERCSEGSGSNRVLPLDASLDLIGSSSRDSSSSGYERLGDNPGHSLDSPGEDIVQAVHGTEVRWVSPDIKDRLDQLGWPRFFMDFETVQQGVPILRGTRPYDAIPFQWSVHQWCSKEQNIRLSDALGYLNFYSAEMDTEFMVTLLNALGENGPVFVHNASFEKRILRETAKRIGDPSITANVEGVIERIVDTLAIARKNFYSPEMMGSYSLKSIVKSIPTTVDYSEEDGLSDGEEAQLAWHICTNRTVDVSRKAELEERLKKYCAKDTLAIYDFISYLSK